MGREAGNRKFEEYVQRQVDALSKRTIYHTLELGDGTTLAGMIGIDALRKRLESFPIPADLTGKRALDVGAASGWNSFELEGRGASVVALDCAQFEELSLAKRIRGSKVDYRILDVDEISPESVGFFDYVLFFGVFYHLRHPLLGLEKICAITREAAFIESYVIDSEPAPGGACVLEFYEVNELGGQIDNWYGPSVNALLAMCRAAGFARVKLEYVYDGRAGVTAWRKWEPAPEEPTAEAPWLCSAVNNRTLVPRFHPLKDEYISLYFRSSCALTKEELRVEIDGYGVPVLTLTGNCEEHWQADLKTPPGLLPGEHTVRMRTVDSPLGNTLTVTVGEAGDEVAVTPPVFAEPDEASEPAPVWVAAENCKNQKPVFHGYKAEYLCCRFLTPETGLHREDILVELDGAAQHVLVLSHLGGREWQTNSRLPVGLGPGPHQVRIRTARSRYSEPREILFQPEA